MLPCNQLDTDSRTRRAGTDLSVPSFATVHHAQLSHSAGVAYCPHALAPYSQHHLGMLTWPDLRPAPATAAETRLTAAAYSLHVRQGRWRLPAKKEDSAKHPQHHTAPGRE